MPRGMSRPPSKKSTAECPRLCIRERGGTTGKGAGVINQMNEKGPSVGQRPFLLRLLFSVTAVLNSTLDTVPRIYGYIPSC